MDENVTWESRTWGRTVVLVIAVLSLTLSGCTSGSENASRTAPSSATTENRTANDMDRHFAQSLAPHHDQAIQMSAILLDKAGVDPDLRAIAVRIRHVHQTQLDAINTWTWAQDRSAHDTDEDGPSHHGGEDGLLTEDQMKALDLAVGTSAEILYLDGMIQHHQGALTVATPEATTGKKPDAVTLAQAIVDHHPTEIATLHDLRARL